MPNLLDVFGESLKEKGSFQKTLFYLLKEIPIYPFDVEFIATPIYEERTFWIFKWKKKIGHKIIKKGMSAALFRSLIKNLNEHYEQEKKESERVNGR